MRGEKPFGGRAAVALAALALAVQVSLPLLLAVELHFDVADALAIELPQAASAAADRGDAAAANPPASGHHCTCPICEILAASQWFALVAHPILTLPHQASYALIALESALLLPVSSPFSYQARAPPVAG